MRQCASCGTTVAEVNADGVCPRCVAGQKPARAPDSVGSLLMSGDAAEKAGGREARPVPATIRYLGDYELLAEIGRGGMGVVYKARQMSLNRLVAVKMILAGEFARPAEIQRFRTEAEAAANLRHPGIVTIFEVGEHEGHQYYSMDLVEGESLASLINRQHLPLRQAAGLVVQIARAVHFAHQRGIIHRDLKPSNVLLDASGQAKVVDFGLAKQADRHQEMTLSGALLGTPAYMSPEQAQGKSRQITFATDVYSLGAILFHLLTGRPPFAADSSFATIKAVIEAAPPSPSQLNPALDLDLETICLKCLSKAPGQRYASAEALAEDLERWLAGQPILARPATGFQKARMWLRSRFTPLQLGSYAVLAALVCSLAWVIGWQLSQGKTAKGKAADRAFASGVQSSSPQNGVGASIPNDGIPFNWRAQHFGAANVGSPQAAATADPDGDGCSNYQEFLAGTNPVDPLSNDVKPRRISTIAGSVPGGSNGPLSVATFCGPYHLKRDVQDRIWVTEHVTTGFYSSAPGSHRIRIIGTNGIVSTIAGSDDYGCVDGPGGQARFRAPAEVVFDRQGNAFVTDNQNHLIRKIDTNWVVSTVAGSTRGFRDGVSTNAMFDLPWSLAIDGEDNLYVADFSNYRIRKITPDGTVSTFATTIGAPNGLARASDGTFYYINWADGAIRKISPNRVDTVVVASLGSVERLALNEAEDLFVQHVVGSTRTLAKYSKGGRLLWSISSPLGFRDGDISVARFGVLSSPLELSDGSLLVADKTFNRLRSIALGTQSLLTFLPAAGAFTNQTMVSIVTPVPNGIIRYTLDGSTPTSNSPAYSVPLELTDSTTIKAVVFVNDYPVTLPEHAKYQKAPPNPR